MLLVVQIARDKSHLTLYTYTFAILSLPDVNSTLAITTGSKRGACASSMTGQMLVFDRIQLYCTYKNTSVRARMTRNPKVAIFSHNYWNISGGAMGHLVTKQSSVGNT